MRVAARGLPLVCVNPAVCFGAGDHLLTSTRLVRSFVLGRIPVYTDGAISVVDVRDVAEGHLLADRRGQVGERYILGGRNFTFDRLFADLGRLSGIDPPVRLPVAAARVLAAAGRSWPLTPVEVQAAGPPLDVPLHQGQARARLERAAARGDARGDRRLAPRARARPHRAQPPLAAGPGPAGRSGGRRGRVRCERAAARPSIGQVTTLYRCKAPTDRVCRCGKVARRLRAAGIEFEEVRVELRRRDRPEIEDLTGQRWVPVLVHEDEVIHDSHRILEYLDWLESRKEAA